MEYLTISADTIRLLFSEPEVMEVDHHSCMQFSRKYGKEVWELIFSNLSIDILLKRNKQRLQFDAGLHYTPEHLVRDRYQRMESIPEGIYTIDATALDAEEQFWKAWREFET